MSRGLGKQVGQVEGYVWGKAVAKRRLVMVTCIACAGCVGDLDPVWQLDHDRVIAVRAKPPHVMSGQTATFDALIAHKGAPTDVEAPVGALVVHPTDLASAVAAVQDAWQVVAPDEATLATERTKLGLAAGAPVPLVVGLEFPPSNGHTLAATKTVWLGDARDNPAMPAIAVQDMPPGASITIPIGVDVPMATDVDPAWQVSWLTSCGTMHDDDEHAAFDHVEPDDPKDGELATIIRDDAGGVVWQVWPIAAR